MDDQLSILLISTCKQEQSQAKVRFLWLTEHLEMVFSKVLFSVN